MLSKRRLWNPWYVIAWRAIWWIPTWGTLAIFCLLKGVYCWSSIEAKSAWDNET